MGNIKDAIALMAHAKVAILVLVAFFTYSHFSRILMCRLQITSYFLEKRTMRLVGKESSTLREGTFS